MTHFAEFLSAAVSRFGSWLHGSSGLHARRHGGLRNWMPKQRHLNWSSSVCYEPEGQVVLQPRWRLVAND